MRRIAAIIAILAALAAPEVRAAEKVTASWLPIMQTLAYYVALEEGLFEKAGIEIDSVKFQAPNQIIDSLVSGRADFGPPGAAAGITVIAETQFPGTFKVFGLQGGGIKVDRINDGLIVKTDSPIASFRDLKGKSLGHLPGIQWRTISRFMVRQNGLDPDRDVRLTELAVPLQLQAVVAGTVDATLSLEPVGSIAAASGDAKRAVVNPVAMTISDPFYSGVAVMTTKFLKERPAVARKVVEVIDQATALANANYPRYRASFTKYMSIPADQVSGIAQPYLRGYADLNDVDLASYQALINVFASEGVLKQRVDVHDIILGKADFGG